jgi:hypothetical protein
MGWWCYAFRKKNILAADMPALQTRPTVMFNHIATATVLTNTQHYDCLVHARLQGQVIR